MKNSVTGVMLAAIASLCFTASGAVAAERLTVQGSDTLLEMVAVEAEAFMKKNQGAVIQVTGGGSGVGIASLINGATDIANASRPMKKKERKKIKQMGGEAFEVAIALDGISIYLHPGNPVGNFTMEQLKDIFTGKINNWKQLGGKDARIIRYSRENNSGTYVYFKKHVLKKKNFVDDAQHLPGTASVVNATSKDKNAIGYGGLSYAEGVKVATVNGVRPTPALIASGDYPISRRLFQYTIGKPKGAARDFILFELSPDGQRLAVNVGYVPLPEDLRKAAIDSLN